MDSTASPSGLRRGISQSQNLLRTKLTSGVITGYGDKNGCEFRIIIRERLIVRDLSHELTTFKCFGQQPAF